MTLFRLTFNHGAVYEIEAERLDDDGPRLTLYGPEDQVVYRIGDSDIVSCVPAEMDFSVDCDAVATRRGMVLKDETGRTLATFRDRTGRLIAQHRILKALTPSPLSKGVPGRG